MQGTAATPQISSNVTIDDRLEDVRPTAPIVRSATIYKKKSTPALTPQNVRDMHNSGHVVVECASGGTYECIQRLESATLAEFKDLVEIVDLKDRVFVQQMNGAKSTSSKRQLPGNAGNTQNT